MAQQRKRSGGRVTPSPRRDGPAGRSAPRARVPTRDAGSTRRSARTPSAETRSTRTRSGGEAATDGATVPDGDDAAATAGSWGMGDMVAWFFAALAAEVVVQVLVFQWLVSSKGYLAYWPDDAGAAVAEVAGRLGTGQAPQVSQGLNSLPLGVQVLLQIPLWACLFGGPFWVARKKGTDVRTDFGFSMRWRDAPIGVAIGVASQLLLVPAVFWLLFRLVGDQSEKVSEPVVRITSQVVSPVSAVLMVLIVGVGAPLAEELFFRGLSQRAIAKRYGPVAGVIGAALFFALSHFQLLQLPGLFAFGLVLGVLAQRFGRLGPAIWAHVAFNLTAVVAVIGNRPLP